MVINFTELKFTLHPLAVARCSLQLRAAVATIQRTSGHKYLTFTLRLCSTHMYFTSFNAATSTSMRTLLPKPSAQYSMKHRSAATNRLQTLNTHQNDKVGYEELDLCALLEIVIKLLLAFYETETMELQQQALQQNTA
eukprot:6658-Heterococcus_DN1.PRE.6